MSNYAEKTHRQLPENPSTKPADSRADIKAVLGNFNRSVAQMLKTPQEKVQEPLQVGTLMPVAYRGVTDQFTPDERLFVAQDKVEPVADKTLITTVPFSGCSYFLCSIYGTTYACHADNTANFRVNKVYPLLADKIIKAYPGPLYNRIQNRPQDARDCSEILGRPPTLRELTAFLCFRALVRDGGPLVAPNSASINFPRPYMMKSWSKGFDAAGQMQDRAPAEGDAAATESIAFLVKQGDNWHCHAATYKKMILATPGQGSNGCIISVTPNQILTPIDLSSAFEAYIAAGFTEPDAEAL